jgi:hypothetical protein
MADAQRSNNSTVALTNGAQVAADQCQANYRGPQGVGY